MTYKTNTNQNADIAETIVTLEFQARGWMITDAGSRDADYDHLVDINGKILKVQTKKMTDFKLPRIVERKNQRTTKNGKIRETVDYAERGVDLLIGVDIESRQVFPFELSDYKDKPKKFKVTAAKHTKDLWEIPTNENVRKNNE